MIIIGAEIENIRALRGMGVRTAGVVKTTLRETAGKWHDDMLDGHFTPGNDSRYPLSQRTSWYLTRIKLRFGQGQGRWVLLKLSEKSQRWMRLFVRYSGTARQVTVTMRPPAYFGNPFIGSWIDKRGKVRRITRQPDKPREATEINSRDRDGLREFMGNRLRAKMGAAIAGTIAAVTP
jgi:hypothetical protein